MDVREIISLAYTSLTDRKLRSALTILGLLIGPAVIVALVGAMQGFSNSVSGQFNRLGATNMLLMPAGRNVHLSYLDIKKIRSMPYVVDAVPFYSISALAKYGGSSKPITIIAVDINKLSTLLPDLRYEQGRAPSTSDMVSAVVGYNLANPKDPNDKPLLMYQTLTVQTSTSSAQTSSSAGGGVMSRSFIVSGRLSQFGGGIFVNPDDTIFVTLTSGQAILKTTYYTGIFVIATDANDVNTVTDEIANAYGDDVRIIAVSSILSVVNNVMGSITLVLGAVASISVVVAFIGIMTTMFTAVVERTKEIGLLKALGFKGRDILLIFVSEAALTGFIGGVLGAFSGVGLSYAIVSLMGSNTFSGQAATNARGLGGNTNAGGEFFSQMNLTPVIGPDLLVLVVIMSIVVGAVAGLIPARRAAKLDPVVALRQE